MRRSAERSRVRTSSLSFALVSTFNSEWVSVQALDSGEPASCFAMSYFSIGFPNGNLWQPVFEWMVDETNCPASSRNAVSKGNGRNSWVVVHVRRRQLSL